MSANQERRTWILAEVAARQTQLKGPKPPITRTWLQTRWTPFAEEDIRQTKPPQGLRTAQQHPDEPTGLLQCIHADAKIHVSLEQRTVSDIVPGGNIRDLHGDDDLVSDVRSNSSDYGQLDLTPNHTPITGYTPYQGDNPGRNIGIQSYRQGDTRPDDMINSNNHKVHRSMNKSIYGPQNFDLFDFTEQVAPSVVNLSSHILTPAQMSLLEKGLNFCPTPGEPDMLELRKDLDRLHRLLRIKSFFMKDKVKKSELADVRKAFMDFKNSSDSSKSQYMPTPGVAPNTDPSLQGSNGKPKRVNNFILLQI